MTDSRPSAACRDRTSTATDVPGETFAGMRFNFLTVMSPDSAPSLASSSEHTVIVFCGGVRRFPHHGGNRDREPRRGTVWLVPAGGADKRWPPGAMGAQVCLLSVPANVCATLTPGVRQDSLLYCLVQRVGSLVGRLDPSAGLLRESLAESLLLHLLDQYNPARGSGPAVHRLRMARSERTNVPGLTMRADITAFVDGRLESAIRLSEMADAVDMSVQQFVRAFGRVVGTTPHQFVIGRRIERAKALLETTALSVTEVSVMAGFSTPSHFATTFRLHVGRTPSAYRRDERPQSLSATVS